jgi:hypothetical protein
VLAVEEEKYSELILESEMLAGKEWVLPKVIKEYGEMEVAEFR